MPRLFIAYVPGSEESEDSHLRDYHEALVRNVANHLNIPNTTHCCPHMTFKAPFEAKEEQVEELKGFLSSFAESYRSSQCPPAPFTISGFGHLGRQLVTLDVIHSLQMDSVVSILFEILKGLSWMTWSSHEPIFHYHFTIAKDITKVFDDVWEYLHEKSNPYFELELSHIALLRYDGKEWVVDSVYPLIP